MNVTAVYINTHRYDYELTCTCIASVRYWYPDIDIYIIADQLNGKFNTRVLKRNWGIQLFKTERTKFGWGYGKLETLFANDKKSFLVIDADTVLTGPVLSVVKDNDTDFLVDDEVQPDEKFCRLYYDLKRINEVDSLFMYPGYSFNTGQWFGTSGIIKRDDFAQIINWSEPPVSKFPSIIFQGEQGHLNFLLHLKEQLKQVSISRKKIMIWPDGDNANFINLDKIKKKESDYPYIIHWAGIKFKKISSYPRADILLFYKSVFFNRLSVAEKILTKLYIKYLPFEKWIRYKIKGR